MQQRAIDTRVVLAGPIVLATFVSLCAFDWPSGDDYWVSNLIQEHGLLGAQAHWYVNVTGRFFGVFCQSLYVQCFGLVEHHWLAPSLIFAMMLVALWLLFDITLKARVEERYILLF